MLFFKKNSITFALSLFCIGLFLLNQISPSSRALTNRLDNRTIIEYPSSECCMCKVELKCYRLSCEHRSCLPCLIRLVGAKKITRYEYQCDACSIRFSSEKASSLEFLEKAILELKVDENTLRRR